jgi:hypothetical protein
MCCDFSILLEEIVIEIKANIERVPMFGTFPNKVIICLKLEMSLLLVPALPAILQDYTRLEQC